ncbi:MAG: hypothetical protein AB2695_15025, partial [Candidatus Thiodiazotropha endolucinida]
MIRNATTQNAPASASNSFTSKNSTDAGSENYQDNQSPSKKCPLNQSIHQGSTSAPLSTERRQNETSIPSNYETVTFMRQLELQPLDLETHNKADRNTFTTPSNTDCPS